MKNSIATRTAVWAATTCLLAGLLTGCAWSIGGQKKETIVQPTRGQQLIDLKKAKDSGAITEQEYETQKQKIMNKDH